MSISLSSRLFLLALAWVVVLPACAEKDPPAEGPPGPTDDRGEDQDGPSGDDDGMGGAPEVDEDDDVSVPSDGTCEGTLCGENQECFEVEGQATCRCRNGFEGEDCHDINECAAADRCGEGGSCSNFPGSFSCSCAPGFAQTAGSTQAGGSVQTAGCENIDECAEGLSACDTQATCKDAPGTHTCTCAPGTYGDGTFCKQENDCQDDPCGTGTCSQTPTGFSCVCPLGTSGPHCEDLCPTDAAIDFTSDLLADAIRASTGITGDITPSKLSALTSLTVPPADQSLGTDDEILSLDGLECWPTLTHLTLAGHGVTDLDALSSLGTLIELDLRCAQPDSLAPLSNLSHLRKLDLSRGAICRDNHREGASLEFAKNLTSLRRLEVGAFANLSNPEALAGLARLEHLGLRATGIDSLSSLSSLTQLSELIVDQNEVSDLSPLADLPFLKRLSVAQAALESLSPLATLTTLEDIDFSYNQLQDVAALSALVRLRSVSLHHNELSSLSAFSSHEQLLSLDVAHNNIESIAPLVENSSFLRGHLFLHENPLDCATSEADLFALTSRGVHVYSDCTP